MYFFAATELAAASSTPAVTVESFMLAAAWEVGLRVEGSGGGGWCSRTTDR